LQGEFDWWHEKNAAEEAVHHLVGVKGVTNLITIKPKLAPAAVESAIKDAIERNALLVAEQIQVEAVGSEVILRGKVRSYTAREEAERVAWAAPGVLSVVNELDVEWFWGEE